MKVSSNFLSLHLHFYIQVVVGSSNIEAKEARAPWTRYNNNNLVRTLQRCRIYATSPYKTPLQRKYNIEAFKTTEKISTQATLRATGGCKADISAYKR
uniref:Secreted protein n=1 Tax=Megaselia scalaris TaxID=36166 RepID=T1GRE8_MEGSC